MSIFKALVTAVAVVAAYHFFFAPRIYVADPVASLDTAKEMVLEGEMTEDRFKDLLKDMEETVAGKCPSWRHSVVLVKKGVLAGGEEIDFGRLLPEERKDRSSQDEETGRDGGGRDGK